MKKLLGIMFVLFLAAGVHARVYTDVTDKSIQYMMDGDVGVGGNFYCVGTLSLNGTEAQATTTIVGSITVTGGALINNTIRETYGVIAGTGAFTNWIQLGSYPTRISAGTYAVAVSTDLDVSGALDVSGLMEAGSGNITLTNATGNILPAIVASGSFGASVICSSVAVGKVLDESILALSANKISAGTVDADVIVSSVGINTIGGGQINPLAVLRGASIDVTANAVVGGNIKAGASGIYEVSLSSSLTPGGTAYIAASAGKAGWFEVIMGTFVAHGSFTTGAVVTLTVGACSPLTSTTVATEGSLNIYDSGTIVAFENRHPTSTLIAYIRMYYVD